MSDTKHDNLASIVYISVPDHLHHYFSHLGFDPLPADLLLPIEIPGEAADWSPKEIAIEAIVAGMLKVLAYDPEHEHAELFRRFAKTVRPEIFNELAETGIITARNGNYELAEEVFLALSHLAPERVEGPVNLAISYEQRADSLESIGRAREADEFREKTTAIYRELLRSENEVPLDVHLNAGLFFVKNYEFESGYDQLAYYITHSDDTDKAARAQQILEQLESRNLLDRLFKEAYDFVRIGDEETGIERITRFLDRYPDVWNAWFLLGWANRRLGRYGTAADAFTRAIELGADTADVYNELAICRLELEQYEDSRKNLNTALSMEPENTKIISNLGVLAIRQKRYNEARGFFETVLTIEPNDPIAGEYLEQIDQLTQESG